MRDQESCSHEDVNVDSDASCFRNLDWSSINVWDFFDANGYAEYAVSVLPAVLAEPGSDRDSVVNGENRSNFYMPRP